MKDYWSCVWIASLVSFGCNVDLANGASLAAGGSLNLVGSAEGLVLDGTPLDTTYRATYPNPEDLRRMVVRLLPDGKLAVSCESDAGITSACETPFFADSTVADGMLIVRVWDLYGTLVAEESVGYALAALRSDEGSEGSEDGDDGFHVPELPDDGTDTTVPDSPDDGTSACPRPEEKARFCEGVHEQLVAHGITDYTIDCASIADHFDEDFPEVRHDESRIRRCGDILDPIVEDELEPLFEDRDDRCGEVQLRNWEENTRLILLRDGICRMSPLVLDLDGDGVQLGSVEAGVVFDLLGDGEPVQTAWPAAGDAFLAIDANGNGIVDGAAELFGNATFGEEHADGFVALARLDDDGDRRMSAADPSFTALRLWQDADRDGVCRAEEMSTLAEHGIVSLELSPERLDAVAAADAHGNTIPLVASYETESGHRAALVDAWLRFRPVSSGPMSERPSPLQGLRAMCE